MTELQKTISPVDGRIYVERQLSTKDEINHKLSKAVAAQASWQAMNLDERRAICSKAVDIFIQQKDDIAQEITWQMGRPIQYAGGEVAGFEERARYMISVAQEALSPVVLPEKAGFTRYIKKEALWSSVGYCSMELSIINRD